MAGPTALAAADVHVWYGDVGWHSAVSATAAPDSEPPGGDLEILSAQERSRCQRFVRAADRARFAAAHVAVRRLLAGYLDASPAAIQFGRTPCCGCGLAEHGPPRIDWPLTDLTFNQSGSGDHWLLAISRGRRIGVDIEVPRRIDVGELGRACLTPAEQRYLAAQPEADRLRLFYRCWTRKEAVLKACGIGLAGVMRKLETEPGSDGPVEIRHSCAAGPSLWVVQDLPAPPGPAALAEPGRPDQLAGAAGLGERDGPGETASPEWIGAVAHPVSAAGRVSLRSTG